MDKELSTVKPVEFYELEKVRFIIKDGCGLDVAYAYEDLVFSEHGIFILQYAGATTKNMFCWFNKDCIESDRLSLFKSLSTSANLNKIKVEYKGRFEMIQKEGEEQIDLRFIELNQA